MDAKRLIAFLAAALSAAAFTAAPAAPSSLAPGECPGGYAYAGRWGEMPASGIAATLVSLERPQVTDGHVAAWVNVGSSRAWLQVGVNSLSDGGGNLYYEIKQPGAEHTTYVPLGSLDVGASKRVALVELAGRPSWWQVLVDNAPAGDPVYLQGSHANWRVQASAESFKPQAGPCNRFRYAFSGVRTLSARGKWQPATLMNVADPGYRVGTARDGFQAAGYDAVAA